MQTVHHYRLKNLLDRLRRDVAASREIALRATRNKDREPLRQRRRQSMTVTHQSAPATTMSGTGLQVTMPETSDQGEARRVHRISAKPNPTDGRNTRLGFKSDDGDGALTLSIVFVPLAVICLGLAINTSQVVSNKFEYDTIAQSSAETAVKTIDARGNLDEKAIKALVREHREQLEASTAYSGTCNVQEINGKKVTLPYYEVRLETSRNVKGRRVSSTYKIDSSNPNTVDVPNIENKNAPYRVISAEVYTATSSPFVAIGLQPCNYHKSTVSAISFGSNRDLGGTHTKTKKTPKP
jgi:hypothetical protein